MGCHNPYVLAEALSLHMPPGTKVIAATGHTWRMINVGSNFDRETEANLVDQGVEGYLWGKICISDESLSHNEFRYQTDIGPETSVVLMSLDGAQVAENAHVVTLKAQKPHEVYDSPIAKALAKQDICIRRSIPKDVYMFDIVACPVPFTTETEALALGEVIKTLVGYYEAMKLKAEEVTVFLAPGVELNPCSGLRQVNIRVGVVGHTGDQHWRVGPCGGDIEAYEPKVPVVEDGNH